MPKYRLGVVGLGGRGRSMFSSISKNLSDDLIGVAACDLRRDLYDELAKTYANATFYEDYDTMLDQANLDIVMVETPATCHAEFCAKALERGIHVFSDIPSVASAEEAQMLWDVQARSKALLMTGATTCGWGFTMALKNICDKGLIGKPYYMEAEYIHDCRYLWELTPWRKPGPNVHKYPITYCTHSLGPLLRIIDEELRTVTCISTGSHVTDIPHANDLNVAIYQTDSGVMIKQIASFINNCTTGHHSYRIHGTEGYFEHLSSRGAEPAKTWFSSTKIPEMKTLTPISIGFAPGDFDSDIRNNPKYTFGHGGSDAYLWYLFVNALKKGDKKAPIDLKAGIAMTLPGLFARESAMKGGEKVNIVYPWDKD